MDSDSRWMRLALRLADKAKGTTSPNPAVGAVVVADGQAVGKGWTSPPGGPHAEVLALDEAKERARGSTLYVTLEPCSHEGRTGPCTERVISSGISTVFVAMADPDHRVSGSGVARLREAGVKVVSGILEPEARRMNEEYILHREKGRSFVTYKVAATLDGRTSAQDSSSRWISGDKSRIDVHRLRAASDAICVGIGTVRADDPSLTVREVALKGAPPMRIVVDARGEIGAGSAVLSPDASTVIATAVDPSELRPSPELAASPNVEFIPLPLERGRVSIPHLLKELGNRDVVSLLLEGGPTLAASFLEHDLIDRFIFYLAPKLLGDGKGIFEGWGAPSIGGARELQVASVRSLGEDIRVIAYPKRA